MLELHRSEHQELYDYWDEKRGERFAPTRADFDPMDISKLLPTICLYKVEHDPLRYWTAVMGTGVAEMWGQDYTGKYVDDILLGPIYDQVKGHFETVVFNKKPTLHDLDASWVNKDYIKYSRLMLPMSDNGVDVDRLLVSILLEKHF